MPQVIAVPAATANLVRNIGPSLTLAFVGNRDGATQEEISALGLGNMFCNVTGLSVVVGLSSGVDTLATQLYGAGRKAAVGA